MIMLRTTVVAVVTLSAAAAAPQGRIQSNDLLKLRSVTAVQRSPDGTRAAYVVENNDGTGRPYGQMWVMTIADGKTQRIGADNTSSGDPVWSPDGRWIAFHGRVGG